MNVVGRVVSTDWPPLEISAAFLRPLESTPMEHDKILQPGWRGFRFNVGRFDPANMVPFVEREEELPADCTCKQEKYGLACGCYHTAVDYDALDQN